MNKEIHPELIKHQMNHALDSCEKIANSIVTPTILKSEKPLLAQAYGHMRTSTAEIGHALIQRLIIL